MLGGILNIYKTVGTISHDLVEHVRRVLSEKAGHTGTLDPFARGVILVCWGEATRLTALFQDLPKTYRAVIRFGISTDTYDVQGKVTRFSEQPLSRETLVEVASHFQGRMIQTIPPFSATKFLGHPLYWYARRGETTPILKKEIIIQELTIQRIEAGLFPEMEIVVECSSGTYIRSIAHEMGEAVGTGAFLASLRRERVGQYSIEESVDVQRPGVDRENLLHHSIPPGEALYWIPALPVEESDIRKLRQGAFLPFPENMPVESGQILKVMQDQQFIGLVRADGEKKMFKPQIMYL
ncbi:MAG: tRNA pseudouridine(55) synthase TruB [Candidatus Atribacteria bacterium]|nr:tRNA pseudouridine(55) synthase TruB [Candidatus Atribacteria bacterium]